MNSVLKAYRRPYPCGDGPRPGCCVVFEHGNLSSQADTRLQAPGPDFNRRAPFFMVEKYGKMESTL